MKITDIIRGIIDLIDQETEQDQESQVAVIDLAINPEPEPQGMDPLDMMRQLAGMTDAGCDEPEYANAPDEQVSAMTAAFPEGDDLHHSKNPADIRTNAPSMYPGFQAQR
jgi:hypothetical protein